MILKTKKYKPITSTMETTRKTAHPNIGNRRKAYFNKLNEDVKNARRMIETNLRSIESIKSSSCAGKDLDFFRNRIDITKTGIEKYKETIQQLETKMRGVMAGEFDDEINKMYEDAKKIMDQKHQLKTKKETEIEKYEEKDRLIGKDFDRRERGQQSNERGMKYQYEKLQDISATLPPYIANNLPNMPNNKGYKWRGATFYGMLPPEQGASVVFEKKFNGTYIIETTPTSEVTWFKGKDRDQQKKLVSSFKRIMNLNGPATLYK